MAKQRVGLLLRSLTSVIWLFSSAYALLAFVPFTYRQVVTINLIPAVQTFAHLQPWLIGCSSIAMVVFVLLIEKRKTISFEDRRELLLFLVGALTLGIWNLPLHLRNDSNALMWSLFCLVPPIWIGFFNLRNLSEERAFATHSRTVLLCSAAAGLFAAIVSGFVYDSLSLTRVFTTVALSVAAGCIISIVERFIQNARISLSTAVLFYSALLATAFGLFLADQVLPAIAFFGGLSQFWSFSFAGALSLTIFSTGASLTSAAKHDRLPSLQWISRGLCPRWTAGIYLLLVAGLVLFVQWSVGQFDWNGLIQKTTALAALVLCFLLFILMVPARRNGASQHLRFGKQITINGFLIILVVGLALCLRSSFKELQRDRHPDPLFQISKSLVFPELKLSGIFAWLQSKTNLPDTVQAKLKEIHLQAKPAFKKIHPLIFVFVIDSLRRDYLSAYDSSIQFTPQIGQFAKTSFVFQNAFTRYGATGLSEPSIWAGQMFPHQMYPQPFESINLLHRLVQKEQYDIWISRDSILQEILKLGDREMDLDVGVGTQDLDFCRTTEEILTRLTKDPSGRPFVYSQSQNIHTSVLARSRSASIEKSNEIASRFNQPYALALRQVDTCFGKFIEGLKSRNLYDQSLIILTADHGDSLGEEGRYGHAYTVFPEIMRVPLIIQLPLELREQLVARNDLAFSTDIAPSLASLLGYQVTAENWWEGRPLFANKNESGFSSPPGPHLVMSSYGPVAGLIGEKGESIFITDAINFTNFFYQINDSGSSNVGTNVETRGQNEKLLKNKIDQLYTSFGL